MRFTETECVIRKETRREKFLQQMEELIPWKRLENKIARYYSRSGHGHRSYLLSMILRVYCLQLFYNMSNPDMEDALYEIEAIQ